MPLLPYKGIMPTVAEDAFIAEGAMVIGNVTIGSGTGVWYNTVIRGDANSITIGKNCNIQDNCVIHVERTRPTVIGDNVTIGHGAIVHGCTIEDGALVAIHTNVLNGAVVGAGSIVGAGAVVSENKVIPPRSLVLGVPAKVVRELTDEDVARTIRTARNYAILAQEHKQSLRQGGGETE